MLKLDLKSVNGSWILIDEHGAKVDYLQSSKQHFKEMITLWVRKAIMQQLHDRARLPDDFQEGQEKPQGYRKDMDFEIRWVIGCFGELRRRITPRWVVRDLSGLFAVTRR